MRQSVKFLLIITDEILIGGFLIFLLYYFGLDLWIYGSIFVIFVAIISFMAYVFLPQLKKPVTGPEGMIGQTGIAMEMLNPIGTVRIKGEIWTAESIDGRVEKGEKIVVEKLNGLELVVKKLKTNNP
ncbi:MAG: NfeD family protein [Thermoplasmatales archaeon]|nr:MAG: NfeD family protein [Thermoplasmatales archaeon]